MVLDQLGRCGICDMPCDLRIDHDHRIGIVRELLCHLCNLTVGWIEKDPVRVSLASDYIKRHQKQN